MEAALQQQQPVASRSTYRTVKPPDQCVISYNFEHADSVNFTHNLLIGMGIQSSLKSHRKEEYTNAYPDKQKLFSIITHPKKVFRNQANSVNKAYNSILPKRTLPEKNKKNNKKEGNSSHYEALQSGDKQVDKEGKYEQQKNLQNKAEVKDQTTLKQSSSLKHQAFLLHDMINSPYGLYSDSKNHKSRLHLNQNKNNSYNHSPKIKQKSQPQESNVNHHKPYVNPHSNLKTQHNQNKIPSTFHPSVYMQKENKRIGNKEKLSSNEKLNKSKSQYKNSKEQLNKSKGQLSKSKGQLSSSMKKLRNINNQQNISKRQVNNTKAQFNKSKCDLNRQKQTNSPKNKMIKSSNKSLKPESFTENIQIKERKITSPQNKGTSFVNRNKSQPKNTPTPKENIQQKQNQTTTKGKKQIQDQQLSQLQHRVRRQESLNFKKGNFKISKNKQRQVLPFQASIQPLFANNKQTLPNGLKPTRANKYPRASEHQLKNNTSFKNNKAEGNTTQTIQGKTKSIDNIKTQNKTIPLPVNKLQTIINPKNTSSNIRTVIPSQKIKRNNIEKNQTNSFNSKTNEQSSEDLTLNNQIKGFKVLPKVVSTKVTTQSKQIARTSNKQLKKQSVNHNEVAKKPILQVNPVKNQSNNKNTTKNMDRQMPAKHRYSEMGEQGKSLQTLNKKANQSINNTSNNKNRNTSQSNKPQKEKSQSIDLTTNKLNSPLKSTIPRNANDKDFKLKKWKESQLEQVQRLRRDSKRKSQNSPKPKQNNTPVKKDSKFIPKNKTPLIDLDAQQQDKFGLRTKRKSNTINKSTPKTNKKRQTLNKQTNQLSAESQNEQIIMDESMEQISSIHSSKITELEEEVSQKVIANRNSIIYNNNHQDLEQLIEATEEPTQPHCKESFKNQQNPIIDEQEGNLQAQKDANQQESLQEEELLSQYKKQSKQQQNQKKKQEQIKENSQQIIIAPLQLPNNETQPSQNILSHNYNNEKVASTQLQQINENTQQHFQRTQQAQINPNNASINKDEDFFQYNIKELSKFNQTVNQTFNNTKYQLFQRDINQYIRAPITSFFYGECERTKQQIASFVPSNQKLQINQQQQKIFSLQFQVINKAINILLSIDPWIIQRIFQPFLSQNNQIGLWLYYQGFWKIHLIQSTTNARDAIIKSLQILTKDHHKQLQLEAVLRIISGVRVAKLKSTKKRVFSQLDYSLKKKHVLKAVTSKDSKWGQRLFEVVKVQTSTKGGNVLKIKQNSQYFWVRQQKFKEIFQHFILICTRPSHFWTNKFIANKQSHKSVLSFTSEVVAHGSITLYYPSQQKSSLYLYKELESKVLKYMGSLQQKTNQNGNIYFQFRVHGTYYLFLQTPANCHMAIESQPQYIISQTLKNDKCEYVQIQQSKHQQKGGKQVETLLKLRQKFINMISTK